MLGMPTVVSIQMVAHVDQLFGHDDLDALRRRRVDSLEIDQDRMNPFPTQEAIRAAIRRRYPSLEPPTVLAPVGRHSQVVRRERQPLHILHNQPGHGCIAVDKHVLSLLLFTCRRGGSIRIHLGVSFSRGYLYDSPQQRYDMRTLPDTKRALHERFGVVPGTDRFLVSRNAIEQHLFDLASSSPRLHVESIGHSTEGRDILLAAIGSPETIAMLDELKEQRRAGDDPTLLADPAHDHGRLAGDNVVMLITAGIHATEVGGVQLMPELIEELATSNDARILRILDRAIVLIVPTLNPDGMDVVHDWYTSTLGTSAEGTQPPGLYHRYAGHDNNRDWYTHALAETRVTVDHVLRPWRPHVVLDLHQMGEHAPRYVVPPYIDPIEPHVHPLISSLSSSVGAHIASHHHRLENTGVASGVLFDCYSPTRAFHHYHAGVRILAEAASAKIATPVEVEPEQLEVRRGFDPKVVGVHNPLPWQGGTWRLRDIMDYHLATIHGLLDHVAAHADAWIRDQWKMLADEVRKDASHAYVIPPPRQQTDPRATIELIQTLRRGDVTLDVATERSASIQAGSIMVQPNQPFGSWARALLDLTPYPEGPSTPYDVTSHCLPIHMGVEVTLAETATLPPSRALNEADLRPFPAPSASDVDRSRWLAIDARSHASIRLVTHALSNGAEVRRLVRPHFERGRLLASGTWIISDDHALEGMSRAHEESIRTWLVAPIDRGTVRQRLPRIGLYVPYMHNAIDTGWLRLVLEQSGLPYTEVRNSDIDQLDTASLDVLLFAHQPPDSLLNGNPSDSYPARFAGGIGEQRLNILRSFVQSGGTVVAIDGALRALSGPLGLPIRFPLASMPSADYACPGTVVRVTPDERSDLMTGITEPFPVMMEGKNAFGPRTPLSSLTFAARFASEDLVVSGWMRGENHLQDLGAILDHPLGRGRFVGFAFRPHFRSQMLASYGPLINAIMRASVEKNGAP